MIQPEATASKPEWRRWARSVHQSGVVDAVGDRIVDEAAAYLASLEPTTIVLFSSLPGEVAVDRLITPRERHPFGFSQPVADAEIIPAEELGVVLVPALAFDRHGVRLGRGAGYYDELFSRLPASVGRVGITPSALVVEQLPRAAHDIPMHLLITEAGILEVSGG